MLEKNQAERATAKELKDLIKSCNIIDDTIKIDKIDTLWIEEPNKKVNLLKTKKYILPNSTNFCKFNSNNSYLKKKDSILLFCY
jgi:hypothetical protein